MIILGILNTRNTDILVNNNTFATAKCNTEGLTRQTNWGEVRNVKVNKIRETNQ